MYRRERRGYLVTGATEGTECRGVGQGRARTWSVGSLGSVRLGRPQVFPSLDVAVC